MKRLIVGLIDDLSLNRQRGKGPKSGLVAVLAVVALTGVAFGAHGEKRRLVWRDEFNGQSLDTNR